MNGDISEFYANAAQVTTAIYDVVLNFRVQTPTIVRGDGPPISETSSICTVRMSPQHAKSLAAILAKQIIDYEHQHKVELPIPSDMKELWDKYIKKGG